MTYVTKSKFKDWIILSSHLVYKGSSGPCYFSSLRVWRACVPAEALDDEDALRTSLLL